MAAVTASVGDPPHAATLPAFVRLGAERFADLPAVRFGEVTMTYAQLEQRSATLAAQLVGAGVGKGTRVGFIVGNNFSFVIVLMAVTRIGAIAVPLSTFAKGTELAGLVRHSDVQGLLVQQTLLGHDLTARVADALPSLRAGVPGHLRLREAPLLRWVASLDRAPDGSGSSGFLPTTDVAVDHDLLVAIEHAVHPSDDAIEIYTSGSTATPKGVKHSHGAVLLRTHELRRDLGYRQGALVAVSKPMFWVGGLMIGLLPALDAGATALCTESTSADSKTATGSVIRPEHQGQIATSRRIWALGMTETLGPYSFAGRLRADGYPLCPPLDHVVEHFEVRVVGPDGRAARDGETGEIVVRGPAVTRGIHKLDRRDVFDADGFYRTGDLGVVDGSSIHFVGRRSDMIKTKGANVAPAEVEEALQQMDAIESAYVVGLDHPVHGQVVAAVVVPDPAAPSVSPEAIDRYLRARISTFKRPRLYAIVGRDAIPLLPSNKIDRRKLSGFFEPETVLAV